MHDTGAGDHISAVAAFNDLIVSGMVMGTIQVWAGQAETTVVENKDPVIVLGNQ